MRRIYALTVLLVALAVGLGGCAHRTIKTTRQLEENQDVWSFSGTLPGHGLIPKFAVRWTRGVGSGDVSAYGSTALWFFEAGGGYRHYLGNLHLDVEGRYLYASPMTGELVRGVYPARLSDSFIANVSLTTSTTSSRNWYVGTQMIAGVRGPVSSEPGLFSAGSAGVLFGYEGPARANPGFQFELMVSLIGLKQEIGSSSDQRQLEVSGPLAWSKGTQLSLGWNWY